MSSENSTTVLISGAGPVGLLIAVALGKANIPTIVCEKYKELPQTTRAIVYRPIVLSCLRELGLLETLKEKSYINRLGIVWRNEKGEKLAQMPGIEDEFVLLLGQVRMTRILLEIIQEKYPSVTVHFGQAVVGVERPSSPNPSSDSLVKTMIHDSSNGNDYFINSSYVLATDGANSTVRRSLCVPFQGDTRTDIRMVGLDVYFDFAKNLQWGTPMNFIVHPKYWAVIIYTGQDANGEPYGSAPPLYRIAYGEPSHLPMNQDAILERANERIKNVYTSGRVDFSLVRGEPYLLNQRCAAQASMGNVFFAGDALHSNNPIGGLGLTTGILDSFVYGNALVRVIKDGENPSLLKEAADSRRQAWIDTTNEESKRNLKMIESEDEAVVKQRDQFFRKLNEDPSFTKHLRGEMDKMLPRTFMKDENLNS